MVKVSSKIYAYAAIIVFFVIGFLYVSSNVLAASPPAIITYQGKILSGGAVVTTAVPIKFVIYNAPSAGSALYSAAGTTGAPTAVSVTPTSGLFTIDLGAGVTNSIDSTIFQTNASLYLEVTVNGETLSPRKQLTAAPYALNAMYLNGYMTTSTPTSTAYVSLTDSSGNLNLNNVTTTKIKLTNGILWGTGNYTGVTNTVPTITVGPQLMWIPEMAAFRAGYNSSPGGIPKWGPLNMGSYSASFGSGNYARGDYSLSSGFLSAADGGYSVALGYQTTASGAASVALGGITDATGDYSFATGYHALAGGSFSAAIGSYATALNSYAFAMGYLATADGVYSHAVGTNVSSSGQYSSAFGSNIHTVGNYSVGIGLDANIRSLSSANTMAIDGGNVWVGTTTWAGTAYRLVVDAGSSAGAGIGVNGYIKAAGFITGTTTLDLAEVYPIDPLCHANNTCPQPGDAVCVSANGVAASITKCTAAYSPNAIGIISTDPGFTLGGLGDENSRKVALAGRVPLKIDYSGGSIKAGDHLATSNIAGVAQKALKDGPTIGIALEDSNGSDTILTLVKVEWWWPTLESALTNSGVNTPPPADFLNSITSWLQSVGVSALNGVLEAKEFIAEKITGTTVTARTQLCVGTTCINESQLQEILRRQQNEVFAPVLTPPQAQSSLPVGAIEPPPANVDTSTVPAENATSSPQ